jgi:hypothetical protein
MAATDPPRSITAQSQFMDETTTPDLNRLGSYADPTEGEWDPSWYSTD